MPPTPTARRHALLAALLCAAGMAAAAQEAAPPTLAWLGFELLEDQPEPALEADHRRRLAAIDAQMRQGLEQAGLYRVLDPAPAQDLVAQLRAQHEFVYRCNACLDGVGRRLGTRLVAVGWVQKVSNLILNVNVSVRDAETDEELLSKSVDMRGNTDDNWARAVRFMLRDWRERRAANPRYGLPRH